MQLYICEYQDSLIYTLFDSCKRSVLHPTRYFDFLRRTNCPESSQKLITNVIKLHCEWIEKHPRFQHIRVDEALSMISGDDIVNWINYQRQAELSENTIHNREVIVRQMYEYFTSDEAHVRESTPWRRRYFTRRQHRKLPRYLTQRQVITLLQGMHNESQRAAAHLMIDTGVRISELTRLKCRHLPREKDFPEGYNYFPL
jgi:site-specific recombinase XerD